ncbi:MAG TPA: hypothetical protein VF588_14090 [Pyrinomonadaceae bacterium]|jgi:hypothetical protein
MGNVDFAKLSEQYASFLVAAGGVSITVLTLVLGLSSATTASTESTETDARLFLVAALIAATVSCFVGAHMMAETAAVFTLGGQGLPEGKPPAQIPLGRRLFVLASSHIFITIVLVLFSIVLLPTATGKVELAASLRPITHVVFVGVVIGALVWMALAAVDRTGVGGEGWYVMAVGLIVGSLGGVICHQFSKDNLAQVIFIIIVSFTAVSLLYFAIIFKLGKACARKTCLIEIGLFSSAITLSYIALIISYFKIL